MTVVRTFTSDENLLARVMALCSDAELAPGATPENPATIGEPTEAALVAYAFRKGMNKNETTTLHPRSGAMASGCSRNQLPVLAASRVSLVRISKGR